MFIPIIMIAIGFGGLLILVSSFGVASYLDDRNVKIDYLKLRCMFPQYMAQYKMMTIEENGHVGVYYYLFWLGFAVPAICGIMYAIS